MKSKELSTKNLSGEMLIVRFFLRCRSYPMECYIVRI